MILSRRWTQMKLIISALPMALMSFTAPGVINMTHGNPDTGRVARFGAADH